MKEKLERLRDLNKSIAYLPKGGSTEGYMCAVNQGNLAKQALALLDSLIAELDSKAKVNKYILEQTRNHPYITDGYGDA